MKILDTVFKMTKTRFRFRGVKEVYYESNINMSINNFKIVNFPFLQGIRFNIFSFTPTITEVINRSSDLSTTFRETNIIGKSIFRTFRNNITNFRVRNDIKIACNRMPCMGI